MSECDVCGENDWIRINPTWKRCNKCGRLETRLKKRYCSKCGKELGTYAKRTEKKCLDCRGASNLDESSIPCKTPACPNSLGKLASYSGYCRQCLQEMDSWKGEEPHLWKVEAFDLFQEELRFKYVFDHLCELYPEMTVNTLVNWIDRNIRDGLMEKTRHGVYVMLTDNPNHRYEQFEAGEAGQSITTIRLSPLTK